MTREEEIQKIVDDSVKIDYPIYFKEVPCEPDWLIKKYKNKLMTNPHHQEENIKESEWKFLRDTPIKLSEIGLTNHQIISILIVVYGNETKKKAGEMIGISPQAIADNIKGGLKKIEKHFKDMKIKKEGRNSPIQIFKRKKL